MEFTPGRDIDLGNNDNGHTSFGENFWTAQSKEYGINMVDITAPYASVESLCKPQKVFEKSESVSTDHVKVDMSRIDQLLSMDNPQNLGDLGTEVFMMLDRFNSAINQFGAEYISACQERDRDIAEADADARRQREQIEQEHSENLARIKQEADMAIEDLNMWLREAKLERQSKLLSASNELKQFRATSEEELTRLHMTNEAQSGIINDKVLSDIMGYYDSVRRFVKKNIASEMERTMEEVSRKTLSDGNAWNFLSEQCKEDAKLLYDSIFLECQKIVRRRLSKLCEKLAVLCGQAKWAYLMLISEHEKMEKATQANYEVETAKREASIENTKEQFLIEDESQQRYVDSQINQIINSSNAHVSEENTRYQNTKGQVNATLQVQENNRINRWFEELEYKKNSFYEKMEVVFPASHMKSLYNKLDILSEFINVPFDPSNEPKHNIAIGVAMVNCVNADIKGSDAYSIIQHLIDDKYPYMHVDARNVDQVKVPYIISVDAGAAMLLKYNDRFEDKLKDLVNGISIRMLWSVPASLQEFCMLDTAAIGSFAPLQYMDPAQNPAAAGELVKSMIVGGKVFQKKEDMARQIDEMRTRFESRKGSMGFYKTLREFNSSHFMSREAYQSVIVQHFPMNLEADSVMDITTMIRDCRMAGLSAILAMPESSENYMDDQVRLRLRDLESYVTILQLCDDGSFVMTSNCSTEAERSARILIFPTPEDNRLVEMRTNFFEASLRALKVAVDFNSVAPEVKRRYQTSASQGLVIPLGLMRGGSNFELRMDDIHIHTILSGVTGSGKTNLLHVLLMNIMLHYSPNEVEIYLIDFKHGVDFSVYSNYNLPNLRVLSITSEAEFPLAALEELEMEFDRRAYDLDGTLGIAEYNRMHPENRMKRIVLIMDELYVLMRDSAIDGNQNNAEKIMQIIDKIVHKSRAFGIHVMISGQDITKIAGIENIINQCANRIVMHSSDEDIKTLLGDGDAAKLMHEIKPSSQGTCVFSNDYASTAKLAYTAKNESVTQFELLEDISKHYPLLGEKPDVRILLTEPSKSKYHPFRRFVDEGALPEKECLFIGEPLTLLKDFNYYPDKNLWILGGYSVVAEMAGYGAMFSSLMSLLLVKLKAKERGEEFEILCADGSDDGTGNIDRNDRFWQFCDSLIYHGDLIRYVTGTELSKHIHRLTETILIRKGKEEKAHPIWFLISMVDECYWFSDKDKMALRKILDDGPQNGIHTIFWTKDTEFAKQFHLSDAPCDKLILETTDLDSFGVKIKHNTAARYKAQMLGAHGGTRLRLYDLPVQPWFESILQRIYRL